MQIDCESLLSVKVKGRSVGLRNYSIITCVCIPPGHSGYEKPHHFDELDHFPLTNVSNDHYYIINGDLNSHTGSLPDITQTSDSDPSLLMEEDICDILRSNSLNEEIANQDTLTDRSGYGKKLIEIW